MNHHRHSKRDDNLSLPLIPPRPYSQSSSLLTPTPTPSRLRHSSSTATTSLFLTTFLSIFSLYNLHPLLQNSPNFPLSIFCFLLTFVSATILFILSPRRLSLSPPLFRPLFAKSVLVALALLLKFQSLRYAGPANTLLAEFAGGIAAKFAGKRRKVYALLPLFVGLVLLGTNWDRLECSPSNFVFLDWLRCFQFSRIVFGFFAGVVGYLEGSIWGSLKISGRKSVRLYSLWFASALFLPFMLFESLRGNWAFGEVGFAGMLWPLATSVLFGVVLNEVYCDEKYGFVGSSSSRRGSQREFLVLLSCACILELLYFAEFSLIGFGCIGLMLWISARILGSESSDYPELGIDSSELFHSTVMSPIRHILSERKSRKIALFLLINTAYMVVEFAVGFMSNSLGLISDACHMLFDCAALAIGLYASYISRLPANSKFQFGRGRFEVLSGYVNAVFLVLVGALIVLESFERILDPQDISTNSLFVVSIGGLLVNLVGLVFFHEEHHHAHGGVSCSHSHGLHSHSDGHGNHVPDAQKHHAGCAHDHHEPTSVNDSAISQCSHHEHQSQDHHHQIHHDHGLLHVNVQQIGDVHENHDHHSCIATKSCSGDHSQQHSSFHTHEDHNHEKFYDLSLPNGPVDTDKSHTGTWHGLHKHSNAHLGSAKSQTGESHRKDGKKHHHVDHNMEGIFLHVLADTLGSVGVVISTLLIKYKGWLIADPACSIFISIMIISSVIPLLRNSADILLLRVPRFHENELKEGLKDIMKIKEVHDIQNIHIWSLTNADAVSTLHLHVSPGSQDEVSKEVSHILQDLGVKDLTLQMEHS